MTNQMIFKRYEIKYMLNRQQYTALRSLMKNYMTADPHSPSTIQSLYFDTPDYLLIRHSLEKPLYKEKLRLRSYGIASPETPVFVELKKNTIPLYTNAGLRCPSHRLWIICYIIIWFMIPRLHMRLTIACARIDISHQKFFFLSHIPYVVLISPVSASYE